MAPLRTHRRGTVRVQFAKCREKGSCRSVLVLPDVHVESGLTIRIPKISGRFAFWHRELSCQEPNRKSRGNPVGHLQRSQCRYSRLGFCEPRRARRVDIRESNNARTRPLSRNRVISSGTQHRAKPANRGRAQWSMTCEFKGRFLWMISDESFRSVAKRKLYGKYGVKEYWLIDFQKQTIEVYLLQGQKLQLQSILTEEDEITSSVLPGYRGKSADLFGGTKNRIKPTRT